MSETVIKNKQWEIIREKDGTYTVKLNRDPKKKISGLTFREVRTLGLAGCVER